MLAVLTLTLMQPAVVRATSYKPLVKAGHQYGIDPNPETQAALERAQAEAILYDFLTFRLPFVILFIVIIIRMSKTNVRKPKRN
jgi:hypothetical protein